MVGWLTEIINCFVFPYSSYVQFSSVNTLLVLCHIITVDCFADLCLIRCSSEIHWISVIWYHLFVSVSLSFSIVIDSYQLLCEVQIRTNEWAINNIVNIAECYFQTHFTLNIYSLQSNLFIRPQFLFSKRYFYVGRMNS